MEEKAVTPKPRRTRKPKANPALSDGEAASETLPLVPLRDNVVFPFQLAPLAAGRARSVAALEAGVNADGRVVLAIQRNADTDEVRLEDIYPVAVIAAVGAFRRLPTGGAQALVEGQRRVVIENLEIVGEIWQATVRPLDETLESTSEVEALASSVKGLFADYVSANAPVGPETAVAMARATDPLRIADLASGCPDASIADRVALLEERDPVQRLRLLVPLLAKQVEIAQLRTKIHEDVQKTINKSQREHILREQLRAIRQEISELEGKSEEESDDLVTKIESAHMPEAIKTRALKEAARLEQIPSASPEVGIVRTYLDWLLDVPWGDPPLEVIDIDKTAAILDEDHYGLTKVKDRLLEWLAVRDRMQRKLVAEQENEQESEGTSTDAESNPVVVSTTSDEKRPRVLQTPILCFVGPPGVGKTSLGRSIARALGRKFVRLSLGGIRDEAEIRGHRRTYVGALPGRIIQSMKQAGTRNPVIMLDEIDKVGVDFRGDPSAALLEVLDPEQNCEFSDHYLEVPYDLSQVLFITTANIAETISPPLRDRMEVIRMSGYTEEEKIGIAERHLIPKQLEQHGLNVDELEITHDAIVSVLHGYTREAGVRQLDRNVAQITRKVPRKLVASGDDKVVVKPDDLHDYLGPQRFDYGEAQERDEIGAVTGVVVSEVGGDIITVEALAIEGRSDLMLTGQLGAVMEESAKAALSWAKVHGTDFGVPKDFFENHGLHIHVPAGAIPKDGPSAGITMTTAVISAASGRPVRRDLAMTGEVTLRGRVLPIGGVKDKLLAAHRSGLKAFILPRKNMRDLEEVEKAVVESLEIIPVDSVGEVLAVALLDAKKERGQQRMGFFYPVTSA